MKLLGDAIHDVAVALGFAKEEKPCLPCEKRRAKLNAADKRLRERMTRGHR